jgi:hypothetical protein
MSWLSQYLTGQGGDPAGAARGYYEQIPGMAQGYFNPFIQRGERAGGILEGQFGQMAQDPSAFIAKIMEGYTQSPGYQRQQEEMLKAAGNTAAAGGMRGSQLDVGQEADITRRLQGDDMQQFLQNVLGVQQQGLGGEQHLYDVGYGATGQLESDTARSLSEQGQLAFQGEREKMQGRNDLIKALMSGAGGLFGMGMPGGGSLGGALGSSLFSKLGWL